MQFNNIILNKYIINILIYFQLNKILFFLIKQIKYITSMYLAWKTKSKLHFDTPILQSVNI